MINVVLHTRLLQWQIHHEHKTVDKVKLRLVVIDCAWVASLCLPHKVEWEKTTCGQLYIPHGNINRRWNSLGLDWE